MADDDYEPALGADSMTEAEEPGGKSSRARDDDDGGEGHWESSRPDSSEPTVLRRKAERIQHHTPEKKAAFAEFAAKMKADKAARVQDPDADGDEDDWAPADPKQPVTADPPPRAVEREPVREERDSDRRELGDAPRPPAPTLDPEVTRHRQEAAADREAARKEREAIAEERKANASFADYERYLDDPVKTTRAWMEAMRGEKFASEDEYRTEIADHMTVLSERALGYKLPDEVKSRIETALTRKALGAYKTNATKRELAEANARETARVDAEWAEAGRTLTVEFGRVDVKAKYGWLAAEDNPGAIVVDVIRSAQKRDGTNLKWDEAAKIADEYLAKDYRARYGKRKHLFGAPADSPSAARTPEPRQEQRPGRPQEQVARGPSSPPVVPRAPSLKYDPAAHRRATLAAFRGQPGFQPK